MRHQGSAAWDLLAKGAALGAAVEAELALSPPPTTVALGGGAPPGTGGPVGRWGVRRQPAGHSHSVNTAGRTDNVKDTGRKGYWYSTL